MTVLSDAEMMSAGQPALPEAPSPSSTPAPAEQKVLSDAEMMSAGQPAPQEENPVLNGVLKSVLPVIGQAIKNNQLSGVIPAVKGFNESMADPNNALYTPQEQATQAKTAGLTGAAMDISAAMYDVTFRPLTALFSGYEKGAFALGSNVSPAAGRDLAMLPQAFPFGVKETMGIPHAEALESYAVRAPEDVYMGTKRPTPEQEAVAEMAAKSSYIPSFKAGDEVTTPSPFDVEPIQGRQFPENNYTDGLSQHAPTMFREASVSSGLELLPYSRISAEQPEVHMADHPDMALGQGKNAGGIQIAFDTSGLKGRINTDKPGMQFGYEQGMAEYTGRYNRQSDYQKAVVAVRVPDNLPASKTDLAMLNRNIEDMKAKGWQEVKGEGFTEYRKPSIETPSNFTMPWDYKAAEGEPASPIAAASEQPPSLSSEPLANPSKQFEETRLVDKAGNIRLDNINTTDDLKQVLRDAAERNDDFSGARRGVLSDGKVLDLADAFGINPAFLDKRAIGEAFNAEQIKVVEKALAQSTSATREAMIKFNESGKMEADVEALQTALSRHDMIQENYAGVTAEAGRALRALKKSQSFWDSGDTALAEYLKRRKEDGATPQQLEDIAKFGAKLNDPRALAKFLNDSKKASFKDQVLFYYLNSLLSGPFTHLRYSIGNMLNAVATPLLEIPAAAASGAVREALGQTVTDRVYLGEAKAQLYAMGHGSTEGMRAAIEAWKNNFSAALPGERGSSQFSNVPPIPGVAGKIIGSPSRAVESIHSFSKTLRYEQNVAGLAYRQAMKEGLDGDAFDNRVADLTSNPTDKMMESATKDALKETYMAPTDYHSFMGGVQRITNQFTLAKIMVPFAKVGGQITKNAFLERTPLGYFNEGIRDNLEGKNGDAARDMQVGRMAVGTTVVAGGVAMTLHGKLTGDGPEDPKQRAEWLLTHKPNTLTVGNLTLPYRGLGPYGLLLGFAANMTETAQGWDGQDGHKLAVSMLEGMTKSVLDQNFMLGVKNALDAVYHPDEYADRYLRDFATNWLPFSVGMGQTARFIDPYQRQANDIFSAARAKIPFVSQGLQPRYDMFGNPIKSGSSYEQYKSDPVVQRLEALHIGIGRPEPKINGVKLTDEQFADYSRIAGRTTHMMLSSLVQSGIQFLPPGEQILEINRTAEKAKEIARNTIKLNPANANIIQQAIAKKKAIFAPAGSP